MITSPAESYLKLVLLTFNNSSVSCSNYTLIIWQAHKINADFIYLLCKVRRFLSKSCEIIAPTLIFNKQNSIFPAFCVVFSTSVMEFACMKHNHTVKVIKVRFCICTSLKVLKKTFLCKDIFFFIGLCWHVFLNLQSRCITRSNQGSVQKVCCT